LSKFQLSPKLLEIRLSLPPRFIYNDSPQITINELKNICKIITPNQSCLSSYLRNYYNLTIIKFLIEKCNLIIDDACIESFEIQLNDQRINIPRNVIKYITDKYNEMNIINDE